MAICECGCGRELIGKQKRFRTDDCRTKWWSNVRRAGAGLAGGPVREMMTQAVSGPAVPIPGIIQKEKKRSFHHAKLDRSDVLKKTLDILRRTNPTTKEIQDYTGSTRASSDISELRANGVQIDAVYIGTVNGKRISRYVLTEKQDAA